MKDERREERREEWKGEKGMEMERMQAQARLALPWSGPAGGLPIEGERGGVSA